LKKPLSSEITKTPYFQTKRACLDRRKRQKRGIRQTGKTGPRHIDGPEQGITRMNKPMTKTQLVAALADAMEADKKTATAALDAIASVVAREVAAGGSVTLPGLGKVACKARPERQVRNPATGETMTKPADKQVKFAIAKALKDIVNA
jgi:DNA-binding protein HU-beta